MKILFIGDIFGSQGRKAVAQELPKLKKNEKIDYVIANGENTTHGRSMNLKHYRYLMSLGIDFFTFGNHTWHNDEIKEILKNANTVRPYNLKPTFEYANLGEGTREVMVKNKRLRITNLIGITVSFNQMQTNPFLCLESIFKKDDADVHIIDFHSETTSEKNALFLTFAGKVSAILGTHTHVQTSDERIYKDTAGITDVGMTGGSLGVIGAKPDTILEMFQQKRENFILEPSNSDYQFSAVLLEFDDKTNKPISIKRIFNREHKIVSK